jgi:hypothetical protein
MTRFRIIRLTFVCLALWLCAPPLDAYGQTNTHNPEGWVGSITTGGLPTISGWARDDDYAGPLEIQVFIHLENAPALTFLTHGKADVCSEAAVGGIGAADPSCDGLSYCPTLTCRRHRFNIPYGALGGPHTLVVFAIPVSSNGLWDYTPPVLLPGSPGVNFTVSNAPVILDTGVQVWDFDPDCWDKPARFELFLWDAGTGLWLYHARGFTNAPKYPNDPYDFATFIPFKHPLPLNSQRILLRRIKHDSCANDTFFEGYSAATSVDRDITAIPLHDDGFRSNNLYDPSDPTHEKHPITFEQSTYRAAADRNGGAIYEFYNKRMTDSQLPSGQYENAIYPNFGAALQVAVHHLGDGDLGLACGTPAHWNPTQAGAACRHQPVPAEPADVPGLTPSPFDGQSGLTISCDGPQDNYCPGGTTVTWGAHKMMNWYYGPAYRGPYKLSPDPVHSTRDVLELTQKIDASHPEYMQVDITVKNPTDAGFTPVGPLEIPTFYFSSRYLRFYWPSYADSQTGILSTSPDVKSFSDRPGVTDTDNVTMEAVVNLGGDWHCYDPGWVTAQNTFVTNYSQGSSNQFITVAWLYEPKLRDGTYSNNTLPCGPQGNPAPWKVLVAQQVYSDQIKFMNEARVTLSAGREYCFRYVIFPYKYDETITTSHGTHTVAETIRLMKAAYSPRAEITQACGG